MKNFEVVRDEDGIIVYDESDDYFDDETATLCDDEEIFTDEYMLAFAEKSDAEIAREKRVQRWISIGVIVGIILLAALFTAYARWRYM